MGNIAHRRLIISLLAKERKSGIKNLLFAYCGIHQHLNKCSDKVIESLAVLQ